MPLSPDHVDVFSGEANAAEARIYVRFPLNSAESANQTAIAITGDLIGPFCDFSHTLPARHRFIEIESRSASLTSALAEAILPDPCFWTPELPFLYRAQLQVQCDDEIVEVDRAIGIRRLGVRGKSLMFDGKRYVLRGVECGVPSANCRIVLELNQQFLRETWTAIVIATPNEEICEIASRRGILLVADLRSEMHSIVDSLRILARWPAVGAAILGRHDAISEIHAAGAPNLLLAQFVNATSSLGISPWCDLLFAEIVEPGALSDQIVRTGKPVIAVCRRSQTSRIEQFRAECDVLQSDLVLLGDFAGYVVLGLSSRKVAKTQRKI